MTKKMKLSEPKDDAFILSKGENEELRPKEKFLYFLHVSIKTKQKFEEELKNVSQTDS